MAIDGVPLFMGEDEAEHSAELLRTLIWAIFRGQEGFLTSVAGRTETLLTPGPGIRLLPGPFVVNSRFTGGQLQAYMARIINDEIVPTTDVPAGFPGGYRYDLVVCNIEDPTPSNGTIWPLPNTGDGRRLGPYWAPRVIENVPSNCVSIEQIPANHPSGARTWSAIPSARIKRPANTSTITNEMITRISPVINPFAGIELPDDVIANLTDAVSDVQSAVGGIAAGRIPIPGQYVSSINCTEPASSSDYSNRLLYNDSTYKVWPKESAINNVFVPTWANYAEVFVVVTQAYQKPVPGLSSTDRANLTGLVYFNLEYGGTNASTDPDRFNQDEVSTCNLPPSAGVSNAYVPGVNRSGDRISIFVTGPMAIPAALRGKKCNGKIFAKMPIGNPDPQVRGQLIADGSTSIRVEINFKEKA